VAGSVGEGIRWTTGGCLGEGDGGVVALVHGDSAFRVSCRGIDGEG
jgi:hypothetical protein